MRFLDPERGTEFLERARRVIAKDKSARRFSSEELHEMLSCWGFRQEPVAPEGGTEYYRFPPEHPDLLLLIGPADPGDELMRRSVEYVEELIRREGVC